MTELKNSSLVYFVVRRSKQLFGLDTRFVKESTRFDAISALPACIPECAGVVNSRNKVLPIILPDRWLMTEQQKFDPLKPVVVLDIESTQCALQFDQIIGVKNANPDSDVPHPYSDEHPYFSDLAVYDDKVTITTINTQKLIQSIQTLVS